eukprot:UN3003
MGTVLPRVDDSPFGETAAEGGQAARIPRPISGGVTLSGLAHKGKYKWQECLLRGNLTDLYATTFLDALQDSAPALNAWNRARREVNKSFLSDSQGP